MELLLAVLVVSAIVFGTAWTLKGLGLLTYNSKLAERVTDAEVALHELRDFIVERTPNAPETGSKHEAWKPRRVEGMDPEIDGAAPEALRAEDLP